MPDSERRPLSPLASSAAPPVGLFALAGFATGAGMRLLDPLLPLLARRFLQQLTAALAPLGVRPAGGLRARPRGG